MEGKALAFSRPALFVVIKDGRAMRDFEKGTSQQTKKPIRKEKDRLVLQTLYYSSSELSTALGLPIDLL